MTFYIPDHHHGNHDAPSIFPVPKDSKKVSYVRLG